MLALARSSFLTLLFSSSVSVLLSRDTEQANRAHHTTLRPRERIFLSFSALTAACILFLLCVYKPHRYISVQVVSDLAGSLLRPLFRSLRTTLISEATGFFGKSCCG